MDRVAFNVEPTWVPIDSLRPNSWNVNEMTPEKEDALRKSIQEDGLVAQLIECLPDGTIIDGEHRWKVLKELGAEKVPVVYSELSEEDARLATLRRNLVRGEPELGGLGRELVFLTEQFGKDEVLLDLAIGEDELKDLIALFESAPEDFGDLFAGIDPRAEGRFFQMTFVLSKRQTRIVQEALRILREKVNPTSEDNPNLKGNCLEWMATATVLAAGKEAG